MDRTALKMQKTMVLRVMVLGIGSIALMMMLMILLLLLLLLPMYNRVFMQKFQEVPLWIIGTLHV